VQVLEDLLAEEQCVEQRDDIEMVYSSGATVLRSFSNGFMSRDK
jgi:hypothetical protein